MRFWNPASNFHLSRTYWGGCRQIIAMYTDLVIQIRGSALQGRIGAMEDDKWSVKKSGSDKIGPGEIKPAPEKNSRFRKNLFFLEQLIFSEPGFFTPVADFFWGRVFFGSFITLYYPMRPAARNLLFEFNIGSRKNSNNWAAPFNNCPISGNYWRGPKKHKLPPPTLFFLFLLF